MVWSFQVWLKNGMAYAGIVSILEINFNVVLNARLPNIAIKIAKDKIGKFTKNWTVCKAQIALEESLMYYKMYAKNKETKNFNNAYSTLATLMKISVLM